MTRPSRATPSGRTYLDLLARARLEGPPADELLTLYVLERFLYRLSVSAYRDRLVLKGGMLLSAFGQRHPTRDIDLLGKAISNDPAAVAALPAAEVADPAEVGIQAGALGIRPCSSFNALGAAIKDLRGRPDRSALWARQVPGKLTSPTRPPPMMTWPTMRATQTPMS